jgi:hypothetical protein
MSIVPGIILACIALGSALLGFAYRKWVRPGVCMRFGEEYPSRTDREATRRRRSFEHRCYLAIAFLYASMVVGFIRGLLTEMLPELSTAGIITQVALFLVAGLFSWAAYARWRHPRFPQ